jgi:polysaccharide biosynthesis protein PslG
MKGRFRPVITNPRIRSRRRALAAAALLLVTLVLAACGGGESGGGSSSAATQPSARGGSGGGSSSVPAKPSAPAGLVVGIGEQGAAMFADPRFKALGIDKARLVTAYDATRVRFERELDDTWLRAARAAGVEPFVTFGHSRVNPTKLPSVAEFRSAFRAFRKRYPDVRVYAPWNEINHASQPTSRAPRRAAEFYNVVKAECPDCTVLAGDVLDQPGMGRYLAQYRRHLDGAPRIWGLHNYGDSNRFRDSGLRELLATVPGDVWLTETGGIVRFGRSFPEDEQRAARAVSYALRLARKHDRVKRLYFYNWTRSEPSDRFDSGLVGPDGAVRPGYERLRAALTG